ncbi:MAG: TolC family protein [Alphaproteobacteria bacterium]|nr:TolC family protein [Alphaproteobacteria bacterium]
MLKILIFVVLFVSGCTVGPDFEKKDVYEDVQIAQSLKLNGCGLKIEPTWYHDFQDETLNALIERASASNPSVLIGIERLRQARTALFISKTQYLPAFNASGSYDYMKASDNTPLSANTNYFSVGFDASWEIDLWGAGRRLNESLSAKTQEAYYSMQNITVAIVAETANTYFLLKTNQEKLRIAQNNLALQSDIFKSIQDKYLAGLEDEAAFRQAKYLLEDTKAKIFALKHQLKAYQNALAVLTGNLPENLPEGVFKTTNNPIKKAYRFEKNKLYDLPVDIIRTRPDVKAQEKAMVAQNAAIGQAVAAVYPNVSVSALFGFQSSAGSKLFNSSGKTYGYEPSAVLPIFHWGALEKQIELEKQKMAETYQNYRQTLLNAVSELSNAIDAVQKSYAQNRFQQNATNNMRKAFSAMRKKYESGLIEYAALLTTEQNLLSSEMALVESNGSVYQNIIAFYKATGGGYNQ